MDFFYESPMMDYADLALYIAGSVFLGTGIGQLSGMFIPHILVDDKDLETSPTVALLKQAAYTCGRCGLNLAALYWATRMVMKEGQFNDGALALYALITADPYMSSSFTTLNNMLHTWLNNGSNPLSILEQLGEAERDILHKMANKVTSTIKST